MSCSDLNQNTPSLFLFTPRFGWHMQTAHESVIMWTLQPVSTHSPSSFLYVCKQAAARTTASDGELRSLHFFSFATLLYLPSMSPPFPKSAFSRLLSSTRGEGGGIGSVDVCVYRTTSCKQPSGCSLLSDTEEGESETWRPKITLSDSLQEMWWREVKRGKKKVLFHPKWKFHKELR